MDLNKTVDQPLLQKIIWPRKQIWGGGWARGQATAQCKNAISRFTSPIHRGLSTKIDDRREGSDEPTRCAIKKSYACTDRAIDRSNCASAVNPDLLPLQRATEVQHVTHGIYIHTHTHTYTHTHAVFEGSTKRFFFLFYF